MIIGIVVLIVSLALITALTVWSKKRIEKIAAKGYGSGRHMVKSLGKRDSRDSN